MTTNLPGSNTAKVCFQENLQLFGDYRTEPEKHNLYKGLYHLAFAVEQLETEIQQLAQLVQRP